MRLSGSGYAARQVLLPAADIDPLAELETDAALDARQRKAELFMQRNAGTVGKRDPGDHGDEALPFEQFEVRTEQLASEPAALSGRIEINAGFDAPTVCPAIAHRR